MERVRGTMDTTEDIRTCLNSIVDPCSVAAGAPAGLIDMGLVRSIRHSQGRHGEKVEVVIAVTEYGCLLGASFAQSAYERLSSLPGVEHVDVRLDDRFDWSPADMTPEYSARLDEHRSRARAQTAPLHFHPGQRSVATPQLGDTK